MMRSFLLTLQDMKLVFKKMKEYTFRLFKLYKIRELFLLYPSFLFGYILFILLMILGADNLWLVLLCIFILNLLIFSYFSFCAVESYYEAKRELLDKKDSYIEGLHLFRESIANDVQYRPIVKQLDKILSDLHELSPDTRAIKYIELQRCLEKIASIKIEIARKALEEEQL